MNFDEFTPKEKLFLILVTIVAFNDGFKKATGIDILKGCVDDES